MLYGSLSVNRTVSGSGVSILSMGLMANDVGDFSVFSQPLVGVLDVGRREVLAGVELDALLQAEGVDLAVRPMSHFSASPGLNEPSKSRLIRLSWIRAITRAANRAVLMCGSRVSGSALKAITACRPFAAHRLVRWQPSPGHWPRWPGRAATGRLSRRRAVAAPRARSPTRPKPHTPLSRAPNVAWLSNSLGYVLNLHAHPPRAYHRATGLPTIATRLA